MAWVITIGTNNAEHAKTAKYDKFFNIFMSSKYVDKVTLLKKDVCWVFYEVEKKIWQVIEISNLFKNALKFLFSFVKFSTI